MLTVVALRAFVVCCCVLFGCVCLFAGILLVCISGWLLTASSERVRMWVRVGDELFSLGLLTSWRKIHLGNAQLKSRKREGLDLCLWVHPERLLRAAIEKDPAVSCCAPGNKRWVDIDQSVLVRDSAWMRR